jgi:hypothetical protein
MNRVIALLAGVLLALPLVAAPESTPASASALEVTSARRVSPWKLVLNDQFNTGPFPAHWARYKGPYGSDPHNCAIPQHAFVSKGFMRMVFRYRTSGECGAGWYSAGMVLAKEYESVDQKISMRFRIQTFKGVRSHWIIPMRWPSNGEWPSGGEEDYCEGGGSWGCSSYMHGPKKRAWKDYDVDMSKWHTWTFVRRGYTVRVFIDGRQRWVHRGSPATLPATLKRPVLQQECRMFGCPKGKVGSQSILVDWIKIWNPR